MPLIKIERILSFTSEDPIHSAENILSNDTTKKWKCKTPGEKTATVVLQLDQPHVITGIDIGNEYSAYIEVLVSRSSSSEDYKMLLVMSSFMTPLDARQAQNGNKVRMFKQEDLMDPERKEKWDRIKVVCTQPFNRHIQYGLSFIKFYSTDQGMGNHHQPSIGNFVLRPESPVNISSGALFARRKEVSKETLSSAAAIRQATSLAQNVSETVDSKLKHNLPATPDTKVKNTTDNGNSSKPRNRNELFYDEEDEDLQNKINKLYKNKYKEEEKADDQKKVDTPSDKQKHLKKDKEETVKNKKNDDSFTKKIDKKDDSLTKKIDKKDDSLTKKIDKKDDNFNQKINKRKQPDEPRVSVNTKKKKMVKPFHRLLEDVVLVISGIQNPERSNLRTTALSMGAKYKADWDSTCTHLICAFANTPKFKQVQGKGKIVTKKWIDDCSQTRKKLPWRRYALDKADKGQDESEEEICEEIENEKLKIENVESKVESENDTQITEEFSDTEEKIEQLEKKKAEEPSSESIDTDNELFDDLKHKKLEINHNLDTFFNNKTFYVDTVFDANMVKKIKQYIVAYKGLLTDKIQADTDIVVTNSSNYKNLQNLNSEAVYVGPDWIWKCHNKQKMVSINDYAFY